MPSVSSVNRLSRLAMKKFLGVLAVILLAGSVAEAKSHFILKGVWIGTYGAGQGVTGMSLILRETRGHALRGKWLFYADASNPGVPSGWTYVAGGRSGRNFYVKSYRWGLQPPGYVFAAIRARFSPDFRKVRGRTETPEGSKIGHVSLVKR